MCLFGPSKFKVYYPVELKEMGCRFGCDTIKEKEYKSLWVDKKGNVYKCTHSSKSRIDIQGRDVYDGINVVEPKRI